MIIINFLRTLFATAATPAPAVTPPDPDPISGIQALAKQQPQKDAVKFHPYVDETWNEED